MENGNQPIAPILDMNADLSGLRGLTKREYFAGLCLQGLMANPDTAMITALESELAAHAVNHADALLAELEKPSK